jgi:GAF domain-containing protein
MNEIAPSLGAQHVELSYLGGDGSYVEALLDTVGVFKGIRYALAEFPLTAQVLRDDVAAQVVLGALDADESESIWMREDSVGSLLMVPVRAGGRVVGLLECHQVLDQPFRRWQMRAARMVSAVAGPVLVTLLDG